MNKRIILIVVALTIATLVLGAVIYSGLAGTLNQDIQSFTFSEEISQGHSQIMTDSNSTLNLTSQLSFQELANNSGHLNFPHFGQAGWGSWHFTSQHLQIFPNPNYSGSTPPVINFLQIKNPLSFAANLTLFENVTGHRIVTYAIEPVGNNASGFVYAIRNGTNYTLYNSTTLLHQTNASLAGYSQILNGTRVASIPSGYQLDIFLSSLPNSIPHKSAYLRGFYISPGLLQISI